MANSVDDIAGAILDALGYAADKATYPVHAIADQVGLGGMFPDYEYEQGQGADYAQSLRGATPQESLSNVVTQGVPHFAKNALDIGSSILPLEGLGKAGLSQLTSLATKVPALAKTVASLTSKQGVKQIAGLAGLAGVASLDESNQPQESQAPSQTPAKDAIEAQLEELRGNSRKTGLPQSIVDAAKQNKLITANGDEFSSSENPGVGSFSKTPSNGANEHYARSLYAMSQLDEIGQNFQREKINQTIKLTQLYDQNAAFKKAINAEVLRDWKGVNGAKTPGDAETAELARRRIEEMAGANANAVSVPANLRGLFERNKAAESNSPAAVDSHALAQAPEDSDRSWIGTGIGMGSLIGLSVLLAKRGKVKEAAKVIEQAVASSAPKAAKLVATKMPQKGARVGIETLANSVTKGQLNPLGTESPEILKLALNKLMRR